MKCTSGSSARCYGEVLLTSLEAFLLVGACNRVLESGRVGRVTGDGNVYVLLPHDGYALWNRVCAIAVNLCSRAIGISDALCLGYGVGIWIILGLNEGEAVDSGDDLCSVLAEAVQDNTKRLHTNLVCVVCDTDRTLSGCEGLVAGEEAEALCLLGKEHLAQVTMAETYLTVVCYGTRDAEGLKSLTDCCSSVSCVSAVLLDCDCSTYDVSPASILEANGLNALNHVVNIEASVFCNLTSFFDISDTVLI